MSIPALIGLGSNLGDRKSRLESAVAALAAIPGVSVLALSAYHETRPVGGPSGQGAFLNAAARLETTLEPAALLRILHEVEARAGRERRVRWDARTLDLDLLVFGDRIVDTAELQVPHPRMALRRFVLAPLADIAPDAVDPLTGRSVADLLANLDRRPSYVALSLPERARRSFVFRRLVAVLSAAGLTQGDDPCAADGLSARTADAGTLAFRTRLEQTAHELREDRWSSRWWGDRWLVTDYDFNDLFPALIPALKGRHLDTLCEQFFEARARVVRPTFVVTWRPPAAPRRAHGPPCPGQLRRDVPVLVLHSDDEEAGLADVLTTCTATRGG